MEPVGEYTGGGAVSPESTPAAEPTTTTTDTGADSPGTQPAAVEGGAEVPAADEGETTSQEGTEEAQPEGEKKSHQKTLEERAEEIADRKIQQRLAEAEQRRREESVSQPDYIPVDQTAYDNHIAKLIISERNLQDELALEPENPLELVRQIRAIQQERQTLEAQFDANEKKRAAWEARNQQTKEEQARQQRIQTEIDSAIANIPQTHGLTPDVVEAGMRFITDAFAKDVKLEQRFNNIVYHKSMYQGFSGVDAAIEWAVSYAQENMSKAAEAATAKRESGKLLNPAASGGEGGSFANINSFADLMKLPSNKINQFAKEHPQKFSNLKEKHFK